MTPLGRGHVLRDRKTKKPRREQVLKESVQVATLEICKLLRDSKRALADQVNNGPFHRTAPYMEALGIAKGLSILGLMEDPRHPSSEFQALVREIKDETPLEVLAKEAR